MPSTRLMNLPTTSQIMSNNKGTYLLCGKTVYIADRGTVLTAPARYRLLYRHQIINPNLSDTEAKAREDEIQKYKQEKIQEVQEAFSKNDPNSQDNMDNQDTGN